MTKIIHQPHDKLIKSTLKDVRVAQDFFQTHLPKEILKHLDLSTLRLMNQSFIDEAFKGSEADIIYQAQFKEQDILLYTLLEHTSNPDRWIVLRQRQYSLKALMDYRKQNPGKPLPVIFCMIIYTGQKPYPYSTDFFDLFDANREIARQYWQSPTPLIDVCRQSDDAIQRRHWFGLVELAFKYQRSREFEKFLKLVFPWLNELETEGGSELNKNVILYVLTQFKKAGIEAFLTRAENELSPKLRGDTMTMAEQLEQRGIKKGIQLGMQQGMKKGMQQGMQKGMKLMAKKLLSEGMSREKIAELMEITPSQLEQLLTEQSRVC